MVIMLVKGELIIYVHKKSFNFLHLHKDMPSILRFTDLCTIFLELSFKQQLLLQRAPLQKTLYHIIAKLILSNDHQSK